MRGSFEQDDARWDRFLFYLRMLSTYEYTGELPLVFTSGRLGRRTLERLEHVVEPMLRMRMGADTECSPVASPGVPQGG